MCVSAARVQQWCCCTDMERPVTCGWVPLAKDLAPDHTVVIPDLRGMGLSAKPAGGYDKKTQGGDIAGILDTLNRGSRQA